MAACGILMSLWGLCKFILPLLIHPRVAQGWGAREWWGKHISDGLLMDIKQLNLIKIYTHKHTSASFPLSLLSRPYKFKKQKIKHVGGEKSFSAHSLRDEENVRRKVMGWRRKRGNRTHDLHMLYHLKELYSLIIHTVKYEASFPRHRLTPHHF